MHLYTRFNIGKLLIVFGIFYFSIIILKIFDQWLIVLGIFFKKNNLLLLLNFKKIKKKF